MSLEAAVHVMMNEARRENRDVGDLGLMLIARHYGASTSEEVAGVLGTLAAHLMHRDGMTKINGNAELAHGGKIKFTIEVKRR